VYAKADDILFHPLIRNKVDVKNFEYQITFLEEKLSKKKLNMAAISEYR